MWRFVRQENSTDDFSETDQINSTNGTISAFSPNEQGLTWKFHRNWIVLIGMASLFLVLLLGVGVWYWYNRTHRLRRRHSIPLAVEPTKIQESSAIKVPPVPPRPTAYTTMLGKIEYRSNL